MMSILESSVWDIDAKGLTYDRQFRSAQRKHNPLPRTTAYILNKFSYRIRIMRMERVSKNSMVQCCFWSIATQIIEILFNKKII